MTNEERRNPLNQMSDTPETDAAWNAAPTDDTEFANAGWEFARELERERNRAIEQRLCECSFEDACRFAIERDALREENRKLREKLDRTKPEPLQPERFPDFPKWIAYEGLGTIKEGNEDIFAHRNLSALTERHNRAIAAFREWANQQAKPPQPDADGWIPHRPGDPMPCDEDEKLLVKREDGSENNSWILARYFDWGKDNGGDNIIAWKPA